MYYLFQSAHIKGIRLVIEVIWLRNSYLYTLMNVK